MSSPEPSAPLPAIDRAAFAAAFTARLRRHGLPVGLTDTEDFVRALAASAPRSVSGLYWCARICLVRTRPEIEIFDAVFAAVFGSALPVDPHARRTGAGTDAPRRDDVDPATVPGPPVEQPFGAGSLVTSRSPVGVAGEDADEGPYVPERLASALEGLADVPFEELGEPEMRLLARWLDDAVADWPTRRSRRHRPDPTGRRIDLRTTIRRARRTGWEPVHLVRERAVRKPRRVVMLCDVSQSMQSQVPAYFHLMRALALVAHTEVFAFATTLTRLTPVLAHRSADQAIARATAEVTDRFGGTRIATTISALLARDAWTRGAVVLIASDGWDSDPPDELAAAMTRLRRRAHRVIWMNPRAGAAGFEPKVAAMAAALPHCDVLLPAHTFRSLRRVVECLTERGWAAA